MQFYMVGIARSPVICGGWAYLNGQCHRFPFGIPAEGCCILNWGPGSHTDFANWRAAVDKSPTLHVVIILGASGVSLDNLLGGLDRPRLGGCSGEWKFKSCSSGRLVAVLRMLRGGGSSVSRMLLGGKRNCVARALWRRRMDLNVNSGLFWTNLDTCL